MKIRITWPLCAVLLLAAICAFAYSCRVKEAFKAEMHETAAKPAAAKPAAASAPTPTKPIVPSTPAKQPTPDSSSIIVNPGAETITLPGQPPIKYTNFSCNNTGVCTYTLQNGQTVNALGSTLLNVVNPAPTTPSSSNTKMTPAPFKPTPITISCPNGENSTTGCCANGEPQGKYPCCPDGTPSHNGKCR